jgi:hypothetical protein
VPDNLVKQMAAWPSSTHVCPELGTTSHDVVGVGNKYSWANSSSGAVVVRRDRRLHSLCSPKTQAAKSWASPNRFYTFSFCFSFQLNSAIDKGLSGVDQGNADAISQLASFWKFLELAVKWITLKDLRLKDSPTSPESQVKTLHRPYICHPVLELPEGTQWLHENLTIIN